MRSSRGGEHIFVTILPTIIHQHSRQPKQDRKKTLIKGYLDKGARKHCTCCTNIGTDSSCTQGVRMRNQCLRIFTTIYLFDIKSMKKKKKKKSMDKNVGKHMLC